MSVEGVLLLTLGAVAVAVVVHWLSDRTGLPEAAMLTVVGIAYASLPGPNVVLEPHAVLTLVLPPLLYKASLDSSLIAIRRNLRTVISLSVALVIATALIIGLGFWWLVGGATLAAGVALGAAVAPPDPVAALAVGQRVGLPPRLITLIQGEGLLNDATALTTLSVAVAVASGGHFSVVSAAGEFVLAAAGGALAGVVVAVGVRAMRPIAADPLTGNAVSLATPFVAYLLGEAAHVSGVLAVVVAGLIVGHDTPRSGSGAGRLQTAAVWRLVNFLLEAFVFLLIGQQLPEVVRGLHKYPTSTVAAAAGVCVGVVLLLRPLWLVLTQLLPRSLHTRLGGDDDSDDTTRASRPLSARAVLVLSWAGTRGVISLAAIFTLPRHTHSGAPFPDRDLLLFCTFVVVLVTLIGQGVTFAPLVRALGMRANPADQARLRNRARSAAVRAALAKLDELQNDDAEETAELRRSGAIDRLRPLLQERLDRYRGRLEHLRSIEDADDGPHRSSEYEAALQLRRMVIDAEREELLRLRDAGQLPDAGLRALESELDHAERLLPEPRA